MSYFKLDSQISLLPTAWSISWWMKRDDDTEDTIFSKESNGTNGYIGINNTVDSIEFVSQDGSDSLLNMINGIDTGDDEWHNYVITSGITDFKLYTDGTNSWSNGSPLTDTTRQLFKYFGVAQDTSTNHPDAFIGNLDEVRFYNKELSASEALSLYSATDSHTGYTKYYAQPHQYNEPIKYGGGSSKLGTNLVKNPSD